jgi:hypothetical protein
VIDDLIPPAHAALRLRAMVRHLRRRGAAFPETQVAPYLRP